VSLLATSGLALAEPPATEKPKEVKKAEPIDQKALMRQFRTVAEQRDQVVRERGETFARITVQHDYRGEYVLFRDQEVTAFLDLTDPRHPRYSPRPGADDENTSADANRRVHILVVPNQPREHIGKTLTSDIGAEDLELALRVMCSAESLAKRLGVTNARVFVKAAERVGIGYLHVHIVGERDPGVPYPPPLQK
jgi:hypothetical protein